MFKKCQAADEEEFNAKLLKVHSMFYNMFKYTVCHLQSVICSFQNTVEHIELNVHFFDFRSDALLVCGMVIASLSTSLPF